MQQLACKLISDKVWWHRTLWWRNLSARFSVFYTFIIEGVFMGVWSFFLADLEDHLNLSDAELGTAVLFVYLGMVLVSPFTAFLLKRFGSQKAMFIGAITFGISLSFIPLSTTLALLILTMFIYGWCMGIMDISMNSGAILTEIVAEKPLLGSFHGSYSVAAAVGSLVGAALSSSGFGIVTVFLALTISSLVLTLVFHANMYNSRQEEMIAAFDRDISGHAAGRAEYSPFAEEDNLAPDSTASILSSPLLDNRSNGDDECDDRVSEAGTSPNDMSTQTRSILAVYSLVGFLAFFGESSIVTWSIVYFDRALDASSVMKSLGFTSFMVCMALGRFSCDYLRRRFGRVVLVRVGGFLACGGLSLAVLAPDLPCGIAFACIGFSITGLGLSTLIPTMFSSAGHIPGGAHAGTCIAVVSVFANAGAICSSPLVGVLTDSFHSMRLAFLCDATLLGIICPLSWGIPEESHVFKKGGGSASSEARRTSKDLFLTLRTESG